MLLYITFINNVQIFQGLHRFFKYIYPSTYILFHIVITITIIDISSIIPIKLTPSLFSKIKTYDTRYLRIKY